MFMVCKCLNVAVDVTIIPSEYAGDWKSENPNDHSQFFKKVTPFDAIHKKYSFFCLLENLSYSKNVPCFGSKCLHNEMIFC